MKQLTGIKKCESIGHASFSKDNSYTNPEPLQTQIYTYTNTNINAKTDGRGGYKKCVPIGHRSFSKADLLILCQTCISPPTIHVQTNKVFFALFIVDPFCISKG